MKDLPTVYVVEVDPIATESLHAVLTAHGYHVRCFHSAEEFLAQLSSNDVGCILIDLIPPGMNGNKLWRKLAANGSLLSVIVVPSWIESIDLSSQAKPSGAVIEKPYDVSILLSLVANGVTESLNKKVERDRRRLGPFLQSALPIERVATLQKPAKVIALRFNPGDVRCLANCKPKTIESMPTCSRC